MASGMTRVSYLVPAGGSGFGISPAGGAPPSGSFDTVARGYLKQLFEAAPNQSLLQARQRFSGAEETAPGSASAQLQVNLKGMQEQPLTKTVIVKYQQVVQGVPIHGADLSVEMSPSKELVSLSGQVSMPTNVNPIARLSPGDARKIVKEIAKLDVYAPLGESDAPQLMYRFDSANQRWVLCYVFGKVRIKEDRPAPADGEEGGVQEESEHFSYYKLFIDAQTGEEIQRVPVRSLFTCTGADDQGNVRTFEGEQVGAVFILRDAGRKIVTKSLGFGDVNCGPTPLPGDDITNSTSTFTNAAAVAAHYNATQVYEFYKTVLQRDSIDDAGMEIISTVNCLDYKYDYTLGFCRRNSPAPAGNVWKNAAWVGTQMIYGQAPQRAGSPNRSYAEALDVVGHEMTHGVTERTANLEYVTESGAMNESYSDIMGLAIANFGKAIASWDWRLGFLINGSKPLRRFDNPSDPALDRPQPSHMRSFRRLVPGTRPGESNDQGYVHSNSGIHNKAAFNLFTDGALDPTDVVKLFYLTLTGRLTETSSFADSKHGMLDSCQVLFQGDANLALKTSAIKRAFDAVGIQ